VSGRKKKASFDVASLQGRGPCSRAVLQIAFGCFLRREIASGDQECYYCKGTHHQSTGEDVITGKQSRTSPGKIIVRSARRVFREGGD